MVNLLCCEQFDHTTSLFLPMALINFWDLPYAPQASSISKVLDGGLGGGGCAAKLPHTISIEGAP